MRARRNQLLLLFSIFFIAATATVFAFFVQSQGDVKSNYEKAEYMVPMRDGTKLYTQIYAPRDKSQKYPIILFRTPYSVGDYGAKISRRTLGPNASYSREGFIFVYQDVRGKYKSEGDFVVMKPYIAEKSN